MIFAGEKASLVVQVKPYSVKMRPMSLQLLQSLRQ